MSAPAPSTALANQVTAVHANILYSFQPDAFQSISLTEGSKWNTLPMGVAVNGSAAVVAQSGGKDALFIVGGRTDASHESFPGFQKFVFDDNSWQALSPETSVAQNRVQHGAAFLQDSKSILIFGGSQDNSYTATSQTYTISAEEPYDMQSWPAGAPAVQNPILLPYNSSHALLAGGGASQEQVWTFSKADGWVMMTTTIPGGVADAGKVKGAISTDGSGNKQLELFDMSQSPYKVSTFPLSNQFHKREAAPIEQRDDSSAATQTPRNGFSLAQDPQTGNVIISGGTSDEKAGSLAIYDAGSKAFEDVSKVFGSSNGANILAAPAAGTGAAPGTTPSDAAGAQASSGAAGASVPASSGAVPASAASAGASGAPGSSVSASAVSAGASSAAPGSSAPASAASGASGTQSGASVATSGASSGAVSATGTNSASAQSTGSALASSGSMAASGAQASKTSSDASSTAAAAAAAASSAASDGGAGASSTTIILAAVLGSFFGIAAIFLIALLLVRYRRGKNKEMEQMREAAALEGKRADSPASTIGSINNGRSNPSPFQNGQTPMISRPTLEPSVQAEDLEAPRKLGQSDEWGRYFNNNNTVENLYPGPAPESHATEAALGGAALGAAVGAGFAATAGARNTHMTVGSEYTIDSPTSSGPRESALVPPLHLRQSSHGQFGRVRSISDVSSNKRDTYNTNSGSGQESWGTSSSDIEGPRRPASSVYYDRGSSVYPTNPLSPTAMSNFPPVPALNQAQYADKDKGMRSIISTDFGNGSPPGQGNMFPQSPTRRAPPGSEARSAGNGHGHNDSEGDMSWFQMGHAS